MQSKIISLIGLLFLTCKASLAMMGPSSQNLQEIIPKNYAQQPAELRRSTICKLLFVPIDRKKVILEQLLRIEIKNTPVDRQNIGLLLAQGALECEPQNTKTTFLLLNSHIQAQQEDEYYS